MAAGGGDAEGDSGSSGGPAISLVKGKPRVLELVVPKGYNFKPASELGEKRSRLLTWVG